MIYKLKILIRISNLFINNKCIAEWLVCDVKQISVFSDLIQNFFLHCDIGGGLR